MKRWRWLGPIIIVLAWLGLAGVGGPTFGKLEEVSSNDQASFLPQSAESTAAREWQERFVENSSIPALVVLEADSRLDAAQLAGLSELKTKLQAVKGVGPVVGPIPSNDGRAVEFVVPVAGRDEAEGAVKELRQVVDDYTPDSLKGYVTGPAGLLADFVGAFAGIDGLLLLVAVVAVLIILVLVYRSVLLPILVLMVAMFALCAAVLAIYAMGKAGWITLNGQSQGILSILVIGAATDYALLLVARFREELGHEASRWVALRRALRAAVEPITASAATVAVALLCLLASDLGSNRSLGPVAATGIVAAWLAALTFLPALLALFGRAAFWPMQPKLQLQDATDSADAKLGLDGVSGVWRRLGHVIARRPWVTWFSTAVVLAVAATGLLQLDAGGVPQSKLILGSSQAVDGQAALARHFDAGSGSPVVIITRSERQADVTKVVKETAGVSAVNVASPKVIEGRVLLNATLKPAADSDEAQAVIQALRTSLATVDDAALVGGPTAIQLDTITTSERDLRIIIPLVLGVILLILIILLRAILAPLVLIATVALSYAATLGIAAVVFNHLFNFPGADPTVPLFGFVFLVALGIDYNIFLMTRVREEAIRRGTRPGILQGLGKTGGVITSAGIVLAATFAALGVIPILFLAQIAFIVAFGVLLDAILVRSLLVPAFSYDIGRAIWWPSRLARSDSSEAPRQMALPIDPKPKS